MNAIEICDLHFQYKDRVLFDHLCLSIKKNSFTTLIGASGSGKSTLVKLIVGLFSYQGKIFIDGEVFTSKSKKSLRRKIGVVFCNPNDHFVADTVYDEIAYALNNLNYSEKKIKKLVMEMANYLNIEHLLQQNPFSLSSGEKALVSLASVLIFEPEILILDEALARLDRKEADSIFRLLKALRREKKMTIFHITNNMDFALQGQELLVLNNGSIFLSGTPMEVFTHEKELHDAHLELPFMIDFSKKLMYYELIDKYYTDMNDMVCVLWK